MSSSAELATTGFFEDFAVGDRMRHARGKTITDADMSLLTLLVMNTAQGHFNEHRQESRHFGTRINFGGLTLALVIGLATQDTAAQSIAEVGLDAVRLREPVMPGDTIYAATEVIDKSSVERQDAGQVVFRHWGFNQYRTIVCTADRTVLLRRRDWSAE